MLIAMNNAQGKTPRKGTLQTCLSGAWGGLEMVAFEVAQKMQTNGHFITTVCLPNSPLHLNLQKAGLNTLTVTRSRKYFSPAVVHVLRKALKTGKYSAVLIEQMNELWQVVPALWCMKDIRLVGISHTFLALSKKDWLHRKLYQRMNSLIALTEIHRENLIDKLPVRPQAVAVLPNSVDTEKFNPNRRSLALRQEYVTDENEILIGVVSRLDLGKGVLEVVRVADRLRQLAVKFKVIIVGSETAGEGGTKATLEREIAERKLQDCVLLVGHRSDIATIIASLDVLLMPSPVETFGRVLIEAMASGVAIVASAGGGVPNIISNEKNGLLVAPLSVEEMAQAIASVFFEPEKRRTLARNGLRTATEIYDYHIVDQKLYTLLGLTPEAQ
jgi:D-inositol-3-phosphate glycosyltransferase